MSIPRSHDLSRCVETDVTINIVFYSYQAAAFYNLKSCATQTGYFVHETQAYLGLKGW